MGLGGGYAKGSVDDRLKVVGNPWRGRRTAFIGKRSAGIVASEEVRTLLSWNPLASLLLGSRLSRASIDPTLVPKRAPALFAGTEGGTLNRWNPNVTANVTRRDLHRFPAHSRDYTK